MKKKSLKLDYYLVVIVLLLFSTLQWRCSNDNDFEIKEQEEQEEEVLDSKVPLIEIVSEGKIVDEPKIRGSIKITEEGIVTYEGVIGIEFRGASSQSFDKKSFGMETWDDNNEDINVSLLGMPEEEDWILHGPYSDKSLMRNKLIYDISNDMDRYASRTKFVELILNGTHRGVYVFMEKLKRDKGRIDINKLKDDENEGEDLTGGYILKIDKTAGDNLGEGYNDQNSFKSNYAPPFSASSSINFMYEYPDAEDITSQQKAYISTYVRDFEAALVSDQFSDPDLGYQAFIDVPSFIDFFILNEISNNVDGYRLSTFMHKDKNGKLNMGPIWDFNLAFGNANYCGGSDTNSWAYKFNERCPGDYWAVPFWWYRLLEDPAFVTQLQDRWNTLRGGVMSDAMVLSKMDDYVSHLETADAIDNNFDVWKVLGIYVWPNNYVGTSHTAEKIYLQEWIQTRFSWLDQQINDL